ncbi:hypothetical protein Tco_0268766 [Tanacetum coccineum]
MLGLWYLNDSGIEVCVYANSDHAGDYINRKCTSRVCTFVGGCLTQWCCKKQTAPTISTTEAEYVAIGKACQQALWMKQAMKDYDIHRKDILVLCDNKGAIYLSKNPVHHSQTKHIDIRHHTLQGNVQKGNILMEKVTSKDNIVDILTKPLKHETFNYLRLGLRMLSEFIFVKETLISNAHPALITDFHHGVGTFSYPYPTEPFDEVLRSRLAHHTFEAQNFPDPIFYLAGLTSQPIDVSSPSLAVVRDGPLEQDVSVFEGLKKKRSITATLEEGSTVIKLSDAVVSLKHESKKRKQEGSRRSVPPPLFLPLKDVEGSQVVKSLKFENARNTEELSTLQEVAAYDEVSRKNLSKEVDELRPSLKEVERLSQRCRDLEAERDNMLSKESGLHKEIAALSSKLKLANIEKVELIKDFLSLAFKKLALNEVHGLGDSWDFKDMEDYHPNAEKIFDEATEAFYKLEFPYIYLLVENPGKVRRACSVDPPTLQEAPSL